MASTAWTCFQALYFCTVKAKTIHITSCMTKPNSADDRYSSPKIAKFCFIQWLTRNKTTSPTPAPAQSPAQSDAKLSAPETNSSHNTTLAAQFGINPIRAATKGCAMLFVSSSDEMRSSPMK